MRRKLQRVKQLGQPLTPHSAKQALAITFRSAEARMPCGMKAYLSRTTIAYDLNLGTWQPIPHHF